jgi:hypothetical protein
MPGLIFSRNHDGSYSHSSHAWRAEHVERGPIHWRLRVAEDDAHPPAYFRTLTDAQAFATVVHRPYRNAG